MVTTDSIVRDILQDEGRNTTHEYLRYLKWANRGLKELTFDVLGDTKVVILEVDSSLRIDLPGDFIDDTFVGVVGNDGYVHTFGARTDIPKVGTGNILAGKTQQYWSNWGGIFGYGGGQNENGYYQPQIDRDNWQMIFSSNNVGDLIYLGYISDGRAEGGQTIVHPYAEEALGAYIYWNSIKRRRGVPQIEKQEAKREYYNQKRLAVARMCSFTKEEAVQTGRKGFKQSPKI
jgi:hypothetical protein